MTFKGRRRMRTVAFRVDEVTFAKIDVLSRLSGLSKQDYMEARVLDESVVVVPSSRVAKMLLEYAQARAGRLTRISHGRCSPCRNSYRVSEMAQCAISTSK